MEDILFVKDISNLHCLLLHDFYKKKKYVKHTENIKNISLI